METLHELMQARREKLQRQVEAGLEAFPYSYDRTRTSEQIKEQFDDLLESETLVSVAGRLVAKRVMGKTTFGHLQDDKGRIQIYARRDDIGDEDYLLFRQTADLGDWVGFRGVVMLTKTGEKTLKVKEWQPLAKCIRPLPTVKEEADSGVRHNEVTDPDDRYRNRSLDLVVNPEAAESFRTRAKVISFIRKFLDERLFLEVETPVLQPLYGGGTARPFETFHNQLKKKLYLRIADELYLKRLIVGGLDRVYEISKDFRNEGVDRTHNPEFTMMECYVAFKDYTYHMELVEEMVSTLAKEINGSYTIRWGDQEIDCTPPWPRVKYIEALQEVTGKDLLGVDIDLLKQVAKDHNIELPEKVSYGKVMDELFGELVEPTFTRPTFVVDYPVEISPLAKRHRDDDRLVERFEAFIGGMEIANSFSELNDPEDQRSRFEAQAKARAAGDDEAMVVDEDYLQVMELGMPPTAGLGLGVDRLVMLLTNNSSIRDVILFPLLRDKEQQ